MEIIANYYSEILTSDPLRAILLGMGIYSTYPYFEEGGREIFKKYFQKYKVLFLLFYGAVFFLSIAPEPRFFWGVEKPRNMVPMVCYIDIYYICNIGGF